jgi:hypothetical protein
MSFTLYSNRLNSLLLLLFYFLENNIYVGPEHLEKTIAFILFLNKVANPSKT